MENNGAELKDRLASARKARGYSQTQVAKAVGMSQPSYRDLEKGIAKSTGKIVEIADFLRVSPRWLKLGSQDSEEENKLSAVEDELIDLFRTGTRSQKAEILKQVLRSRDRKP